MTTNTIGKGLPSFLEEYGADKRVDLSITTAHNLFVDGIPGAKMSALSFEKKGIVKLEINLAMALGIERETESWEWEKSRDMYSTLTVRLKIKKDSTNKS